MMLALIIASDRPIELQEAVNSYKTKAESYLAKLEEAEIARVKSARAESLGSYEPHMDLGGSLTLSNSPACSCGRAEDAR